MQANDILNNLNVISEKLFKSVEGQVYEVLDNIVCIGPNILTEEPLKNIFFEDKINGVVIIANSLILFYFIYYIFLQLISMYNGKPMDNTYLFMLKIIVAVLLINNSYYICEQILELFYTFTEAVNLLGKDIVKNDVTFENLKEVILSIDDFMKNDLISLNGLIKGVVSFGMLNILISFAIRYVTVIFLVIVSPIAISCMSSSISVGIFRSWVKLFVVNMFVQVITKFILIIPLMYKEIDTIMFKIILVGSIYLLYKVNNFTKEFLVKITDDIKVGKN